MKRSFTGRRRRRTSARVRVVEAVSRLVVTVGGIATILAVASIMVFLVSVALPLFRGAGVAAAGDFAVPGPADPIHVAVDPLGLVAAVVDRDGAVRVRRLEDGALVAEDDLFGDAALTSSSFDVDGSSAALGFADGTVRTVSFEFRTTFLRKEGAPAEVLALEPGESAVLDGGVVQRTAEGRLRRVEHSAELMPPVSVAEGDPVVLLDRSVGAGTSVLAALTEAGRLVILDVRERRNMLTGAVTLDEERHEPPFDAAERGLPSRLLFSGLGDTILLVWEDGEAARLDVRRRDRPREAERLDLLLDPDARLTATGFLLGKSTLVVGDSTGTLRGWFQVLAPEAGTADGKRLVPGHEIEGPSAPVTAIAASARTRLFAAGFGNGVVRVHHMTSEKRLAQLEAGGGAPRHVAFLPKEDGLAVLSGGVLETWEIGPGHPEASLAALFAPVWYEGFAEPAHVWQSSSGTDDFEPKLGLMPLVFGTLKATLYSMIFGTPIALLAAIYTSEFLERRLRAPVKSVLEIMASLPSVVLGFVAALVIAPWVQGHLAAVLAVFFSLPVTILLGACVWQLLPRRWTLRLAGWPRLGVVLLAIALGAALAFGLGPVVEGAVFGGDAELWLDGQVGTAAPGWIALLLPVCVALVGLVTARVVNPRLRAASGAWGHRRAASVELARFAGGAVAALALAAMAGFALDGLGFDPRADAFGLIGTYVQRNSLVVGFVMGFAVIPIVYTLAEDALSSVPDHLRLASLGAGATPWQTAMRVVVPTAASGLFSAVMIGLGRAVGETMIVLMATGNTPIMDLSVFSGFRTLSANIAVELPEAVRDSTHYRVLFLAALLLFAMTFVLNTFAEVVRQRFRKRFHQL